MKTLRDRILDYLALHPEGVDDDVLAVDLGVSRRQTVNAYCRMVEREGLVVRRKINGKIRNFLAPIGESDKPNEPNKSHDETHQPVRHWEGNIQSRVIEFLRSRGYSITGKADTETKQRGRDIEAVKDGRPLWVTVKGYPKGTPRTSASLQASHWFKDAAFDILVWRGESTQAKLALALPDFPRYRNLFKRISWLQPIVDFWVFWIPEYGSILVFPGEEI